MDNFDLRKYLSEGKLLKEDKTSFKSHSLELLQADIENAMDENDDEMVAILQKYVNPLEMAEESEVESILDTLDSALAEEFGESFDIVDSYRDSFNMGKSLKEDKTSFKSMVTIQPSKTEYDKLKNHGEVTVSRLSTGFRHSPSPQTYKRYPKGQYEIIVKNPYTKGNEVFFAKVSHTGEGVYLQISKLD